MNVMVVFQVEHLKRGDGQTISVTRKICTDDVISLLGFDLDHDKAHADGSRRLIHRSNPTHVSKVMASKGFYKSNVPPRLVHKITSPESFWVDAPSSPLAAWRRGPSTQRRRRLQRVVRSVEVWTTPCIVTCFGKKSLAKCDTLVNPGNPELSGVRNFPYFPRGGPVPSVDHRHRHQQSASGSSAESTSWLAKTLLRTRRKLVEGPHRDWQPLGYVSSWGGMEVGSGMMYPVTVVDGLVHMHGGWTLQMEITLLQWLRNVNSTNRSSSDIGAEPDPLLCPVGAAVVTSSGFRSLLSQHYDSVVHTTSPFYLHDAHPEEGLMKCYQSSLEAAFQGTKVASVIRPSRHVVRAAFPLVGSGARGFPADVAASVAARAVTESWLRAPSCPVFDPSMAPNDDGNDVETPLQHTVAFGLLEESLAENLSAHLDRAFDTLRKSYH